MQFTVRPVDFERDRGEIAAIANAIFGENSSPEKIEHSILKNPVGGAQLLLAAVDENDKLIGFTNTWRRPQMQKEIMLTRILVREDLRGKGIGGALFKEADKFAKADGRTIYRAMVRDNDSHTQGFVERRGFKEYARVFESVLDLENFKPSEINKEVAGIKFISLTDLGFNDENRAKMHELCETTGVDVPDQDWWGPSSAEEFATEIFEAKWFRPDGVFIALDGDEWIAITMVGELDKDLYLTDYSAVRRSHRGRGIAQVLKLASVEWAQSCGAKRLKTNNDTTNAPMVAVNKKFGFQPDPGWVVYVKQ